jgi:CHAT domain-containing protein
MALMNSLYEKLLVEGLPKAKALQQAQMAMIRESYFEDQSLHLHENRQRTIPSQAFTELDLDDVELFEPYAWSGFTLNGNPW